jgi:hypothetical protein
MTNWQLGINRKAGIHITLVWLWMCQNTTHHQNILNRGKHGCSWIFFKQKASKGPFVKMLKSTLNIGYAFAKKVPGLPTWTAKSTKREKKSLRLWNCLESKKIRGQQTNIINLLIKGFLVTLLKILCLKKLNFRIPGMFFCMQSHFYFHIS